MIEYMSLNISISKIKAILAIAILVICGFLLTGDYLIKFNEPPPDKTLLKTENFDIITVKDHDLCDSLLQKCPSKIFDEFNRNRTDPHFWFNFSDPNLCEQFKRIAGEPMWSSFEEINYPLAFSIMAYEERQQLARLMRIIHRPHNVYCIHIDAKSTDEFRYSVMDMAKCFGSNVLIVPLSQSTDVQWGYYSVLEPTLTCARMLVDYTDTHWKYLLNLNAKEFPILTNWELVRSITALNGSNVAEACNSSKYNDWIPLGNFTFPLNWVKGYFFTVLRRELVVFTLTNDQALQIIEVMQKEKRLEKHPDEFLFPTLVYNPQIGVPGACNEIHHPDENDSKSKFVARYVRWEWDGNGCQSGMSRSNVCIFGVKDLNILSKSKEMFGNKFVYDFQPMALDCMEYWITKKMVLERDQNYIDSSFDDKLYSELYCSKNHAT